MRARHITILGAAILACVPQGLAAKYPEMGGPRQFDLDCRGQEKQVVEPYLPNHVHGFPDAPKHYAVRTHLVIDMLAMRYTELPPDYTGAPPRKIFKYDSDSGILILNSDPQLAQRWAIRLDKYNSVAVREDETGAIWVQHMTCRLMPFSSLPCKRDSGCLTDR